MARMIVSQGSRGVVIKGGDLERAVDVLFDGIEIMHLSGEKINTENTLGIGCAFASALAAELTAGRPLTEAAMLARLMLRKRLRVVIEWGRAGCRSIIFTGSILTLTPELFTKVRSTECTLRLNFLPTEREQ